MTTYYFCTYFDQHYCVKGLALYNSIKKNVESFKIFILCLDDETYEILGRLNLPSVELIQLTDLESRDPVLFSTRNTRSLIEYYFTMTSAFILDVLKEHTEIDIISYIDADMYLFAPVTPVYDEMGENSILIIHHSFPDYLRFLEIYGLFNVGYLSFRHDEEGIQCLEKWREQCIEWCYDNLEGEKFADQKYLDKWPRLFSKIAILKHSGVNVAPWNLANYAFHEGADGLFYVDDMPLIVYHFHGLKKMFQWRNIVFYDMNLNGYLKIGTIRQISGSKTLKNFYKHYLLDLTLCTKTIDNIKGNLSIKDSSIRWVKQSHGIEQGISKIIKMLSYVVHLCRKVLYQDVVTVSLPDK